MALAEGAAGRGWRVATRRGGLARSVAAFPGGAAGVDCLPRGSAGPDPTRGPGWMASLWGPAVSPVPEFAPEWYFACR